MSTPSNPAPAPFRPRRMRSLGTAIGTGALLAAVLVGCASGQSGEVGAGAGSGPTLTTEPAPTTSPVEAEPDPGFDSAVPQGGVEVPASQLNASALAEGSPRTAWTEDGGLVLGAIGQEGGCGTSRMEIVEQNEQQVIAVLVETLSGADEICTMDIRFPPLTAKLDQPLGERAVVLQARQEQKG